MIVFLLSGSEADYAVLMLTESFLRRDWIELELADAHVVIFLVIQTYCVCECHDIKCGLLTSLIELHLHGSALVNAAAAALLVCLSLTVRADVRRHSRVAGARIE